MTTNQPDNSNRLDNLEVALSRFAEISFQSYRQHDEALNRLESAVADLTTQQQQTARNLESLSAQTNRSLQALSQTQTECLQLIASNTVEINRIWQYLERQTGNGRAD